MSIHTIEDVSSMNNEHISSPIALLYRYRITHAWWCDVIHGTMINRLKWTRRNMISYTLLLASYGWGQSCFFLCVWDVQKLQWKGAKGFLLRRSNGVHREHFRVVKLSSILLAVPLRLVWVCLLAFPLIWRARHYLKSQRWRCHLQQLRFEHLEPMNQLTNFELNYRQAPKKTSKYCTVRLPLSP